MKKHNILIRYDKDLRLHVMYPEARREVNGEVVRFIRKAPGMNFISWTFANEANLNQVIDQEIRYLAPMHQPFTWKVYAHDHLPSLPERLLANGFAGDDEAAEVMMLNIHDAPNYLFQPVSVDIRRVANREGLKDIVRVLDGVYGGHNAWVYDRLGMHMQIPGYLSVYAAYVENEPASIAWTYFPRGHFATLFGGTTMVEHRGKGLYTSLLSTRLMEIRQRGYPFAVVEAGPMSRSIVSKHGFQHLTTVWDYEWEGS